MMPNQAAPFGRRVFLASLMTAAAGLGGLLSIARALADVPARAEDMLAVLDDRAKAAAIGALWLRQGRRRPQSEAAAFGRLVRALRTQGWSGGKDREQLRNAFAAAISADYLNGAVIDVAGWRLADTEAELCALAYLATSG